MRALALVILMAAAWSTTGCRTTNGGGYHGEYTTPAGSVTDAPVAAKSDQERIRASFGTFHM
jgi:hypothetical protein